MTENETTKHILHKLEEKMNKGRWSCTPLSKDECDKYAIATNKAIFLIQELEKYQEIGTISEFQEVNNPDLQLTL